MDLMRSSVFESTPNSHLSEAQTGTMLYEFEPGGSPNRAVVAHPTRSPARALLLSHMGSIIQYTVLLPPILSLRKSQASNKTISHQLMCVKEMSLEMSRAETD